VGNILSKWGVSIEHEFDLIDTQGIGGVVPHIGAHLAELTSIHEGNSDTIPDVPNLINLHKKILFSRTLRTIFDLHVILLFLIYLYIYFTA